MRQAPLGDRRGKRLVRRQELRQWECFEIERADLRARLERRTPPLVRSPRGSVDVVDEQHHLGARGGINVMQDLRDRPDRERSRIRPPLFDQLARERVGRRLPAFDLPPGELEAPCPVRGGSRTTLQQHPAGAQPDQASGDQQPR